MAFGSWFKNIINGAKNVIGKALPVLKKGAEIVSKVAPVLGGAIGGAAGNVINKIGNYAGKFAGNKPLGVNGAGIRNTTNSWSQPVSGPANSVGVSYGALTNPGRFDIPLLK